MKKRTISFIILCMICIYCGCGNSSDVSYELKDSAVFSSQMEEETSASVGVRENEDSDTSGDSSAYLGQAESTAQNDIVSPDAGVISQSLGEQTNAKIIYVYVCGAVQHPGVYAFESGSRVYEAVSAAGGLTEEADDRSLNQAQFLTDGQQITIYTRTEAEELGLSRLDAANGNLSEVNSAGKADADASADANSSNSGKININTAGKEMLMTLPGIGEARADAIIQYRTENGGFSSIEEIQNIDGIKTKAFEKIKDDIEV